MFPRVVAVGARFRWKAIAPTDLEAKVVRTPLGLILRMLPASPTNRLSALSIARPPDISEKMVLRSPVGVNL